MRLLIWVVNGGFDRRKLKTPVLALTQITKVSAAELKKVLSNCAKTFGEIEKRPPPLLDTGPIGKAPSPKSPAAQETSAPCRRCSSQRTTMIETTTIPQELLRKFAHEGVWYHSLELAPDLVSKGAYDHAPSLQHYGFPTSLEGKSAIDVGTSDGFFAFHMERLGAQSVLATDTNKFDGEVCTDVSAARIEIYQDKYENHYSVNTEFADVYEQLGVPVCHQFLAAKALKGSKVSFENLNVYDLGKDGRTFDFVFCGDLIEHLQHPLLALENLAAVTKKECIIALSSVPKGAQGPLANLRWNMVKVFSKVLGVPFVRPELSLEYHGAQAGGSFFHFYPVTFQKALLASGFSRVEVFSHFDLKNQNSGKGNPHVVYHCFVDE